MLRAGSTRACQPCRPPQPCPRPCRFPSLVPQYRESSLAGNDIFHKFSTFIKNPVPAQDEGEELGGGHPMQPLRCHHLKPTQVSLGLSSPPWVSSGTAPSSGQGLAPAQAGREDTGRAGGCGQGGRARAGTAGAGLWAQRGPCPDEQCCHPPQRCSGASCGPC